MPRFATSFFLLLALPLFTGCQSPGAGGAAAVERLVDRFADAAVAGSPAAGSPAAGSPAEAAPVSVIEWSFADEAERPSEWQAIRGLDGLRIEDGRLRATSTDDLPLLYADNPLHGAAPDLLYAVEVKARIPAGTQLEVFFHYGEKIVEPAIAGQIRTFPFHPRTPILPGEEFQTYVLRPGDTVPIHEVRHIVLRPTDAPGTPIEIESVRIVPREAHLASVPSGVSWQGLGEIYRESLVSRSPERMRFQLKLPARPRLDLAVGTYDNRPATFAVRVGENSVFTRTVTQPNRWEEASVDLAAYAGREVDLELAVDAENPGTLGVWGSPVVRNLMPLPKGRPHGVLLIVADTLRADRLGAYGHGRETSPTIDGIAAEGALFEDCVSQATWTKVSMSSIMSSRWPLSHGVREFQDRLPATATTLAEAFRGAGYATLGLSSIIFHGKFTNLHQGYEVFHEASSLPEGDVKTARYHVDSLLKWLEANHDLPFFAVLHVADPHAPFRPRDPYDTVWMDAGAGRLHKEEAEKAAEFIKDPLMKRFQMPRIEELREAGIDPVAYVAHETAWYDGSIRAMDVEIGRVVERLRGLGLYDDTVLAFVSDHGEEFLDHGGHWHGTTVYGEQSHVPLILHGPAIPAGLRVAETVQTIDLMPTLLELAGVPVPEGLQGQSLVPAFAADGVKWRPRPAFTTKASFGDDPGGRIVTDDTGMVAEGWTLVEKRHPSFDAPRYELYDHEHDPLNQKDVAAEHPEVVERLKAQMEAWREKALAEKLDDAAALENLDAAELERLRSLGYVQ